MPLPTFAYIDPGAGSALFYVVSGVIVSGYFALRSLWYRGLDFLLRLRHRGQRCEVAIHCEHPRYEISFLPMVRALAMRGIDVTFFTMYPRGAAFEPLPQGVAHQAIGEGMAGYAYLNHLEALVLVTTTPQLDVMTFRRSSRVRHYTNLQHSIGECRYMRPFAFDYFDSVLCCGPLLNQNIRRIETLRGLPEKTLFDTGVPHYEALIAERDAAPPRGERTTVLVAPSWGPLSMFTAYGIGFVRAIAEHFRVIVRPHPQMQISQAELYAQIVALDGVEVDTRRTPGWAMSQAHVLLSDISGIQHEFAFIHERPVLIVDRALAQGGLEGELLGGDSELKQACRPFIIPVAPEALSDIVPHLCRALAEYNAQAMVAVRDRLLFNYGCASNAAATQVAGLVAELRGGRAPHGIAHDAESVCETA